MLPLQVAAGILHSDWLLVLFFGAFLSALGWVRFLKDWKNADLLDVVMLAFATLLMGIVAITSVSQQFINSTGAVLTYQGEWWWLLILWPIALIDGILVILAVLVVLGSVARRRRRGY